MRRSSDNARRATSEGLKAAVHRSRPLSRAGVLERLFTLAFKRLVYPQIWEDPVVDMRALDIGPGHEVIAIASGGCNVLSYLMADPAGVTAVDLNGAHIALGRLKICAAQNLPDYESFFRFFGRADARANVAAYDRRLRTISIRPHASTGRSGRRSATAAFASSRAISTATACSGASLARATRWRACMASILRSS